MKNNPRINTVQGKIPAANIKYLLLLFRLQKLGTDMLYTQGFERSNHYLLNLR